jgi:hypothetical protein
MQVHPATAATVRGAWSTFLFDRTVNVFNCHSSRHPGRVWFIRAERACSFRLRAPFVFYTLHAGRTFATLAVALPWQREQHDQVVLTPTSLEAVELAGGAA